MMGARYPTKKALKQAIGQPLQYVEAEYLEKKQREYGDRFNARDLDKRFIPAFESGERIRVKFYGETVKTGTVGVTTGWKPVFLLMLSRRHHGSRWLLTKDAESTTELVTRREEA